MVHINISRNYIQLFSLKQSNYKKENKEKIYRHVYINTYIFLFYFRIASINNFYMDKRQSEKGWADDGWFEYDL